MYRAICSRIDLKSAEAVCVSGEYETGPYLATYSNNLKSKLQYNPVYKHVCTNNF